MRSHLPAVAASRKGSPNNCDNQFGGAIEQFVWYLCGLSPADAIASPRGAAAVGNGKSFRVLLSHTSSAHLRNNLQPCYIHKSFFISIVFIIIRVNCLVHSTSIGKVAYYMQVIL